MAMWIRSKEIAIWGRLINFWYINLLSVETTSQSPYLADGNKLWHFFYVKSKIINLMGYCCCRTLDTNYSRCK